MATRGRRATEWHGGIQTQNIGGPGNLTTTILDTSTVEAPATLIRIRGGLNVRLTRSTTETVTAATTEGALFGVGVMVVEQTLADVAPTFDLRADAAYSDDRWLWVRTGSQHASAIWAGYWNGSAEVDKWAITPDGRGALYYDIDIKAKRRWVDPSKLIVCASWETTGVEPADMQFDWMIRALFATH